MILLSKEILSARVSDRYEASESNVRTSLSLWHGHDDCEERLVDIGRQFVNTRIQQATKLIVKMTVKMKVKPWSIVL